MFAVGSGARLLSVCYFDPENNWWVSKHIKKPIRSTILAVDWHPSNHLIAVGSCDFKCRVFSAALKEIADKPQASLWMPKLSKFGTLLAEFSTESGWVHGVKFSPSGDQLAWVSHDSSVNLVNCNNMEKVHSIRTSYLPYMCLLWLTEGSFVTAGHNMAPDLYYATGSNIEFGARLDVKKQKAEAGNMSAMARFQKLDVQGKAETEGTTLHTTHANCITEVRRIAGPAAKVSQFSTSGKDGKVVIWDVPSLLSDIKGLRI